jgi:hypothetical protein
MGWSTDVTTLADILATDSEGGQVVVNVGDKVDGTGVSSGIALWANGDGFISRPNDPDANGAAQALYMNEGPTVRVVASRDNRWIANVGGLQPGDRAIVSNCQARLFLKRENNGIAVYTTNDTDNGSAMMVDVNGKAGTLTLINGKALVSISTDKIVLSAGGSAVTIDSNGIQMFGSHFGCNCATGNLGVVGSIPPPIGVQSIVCGPQGQIGVGSMNWTCAP